MSITTYPCARVGRGIHFAATDSTPIFAAADGTLFARQGTASPHHIDQAVYAARAAAPGWRACEPQQRGRLLKVVSELLLMERESLLQLQMRVNGKPRAEAELDVGDAAACFAYYAELCERGDAFAIEPVALPAAGFEARRRHEPVGVAALVVPWNFPMVTSAWKLAPALAAGCTVVLKPSELTSPAEHALLDILDRAGLPQGVVNMVCGGAAVGAALVAHPGVDKVSFTGSTAVGRQVMQAAAGHFKRLTLELGGKSALVVREDADVALAVELAVGGAFTNAGQMCSATSRILVHQPLHARFLAAFSAAVRDLVAGPPDVPGCVVGPLVTAHHRERVQALIDQGMEAGAQVLFAGRLADGAGNGFFMAPLVVAADDDANPLWRDEIFGPVACVRPFENDVEALRMANDTAYGLVATVVTRDVSAASLYQRELRAGLVWINTPQLIFPQVCWGGLGASGIGRELGVEGLRAYQELRHTVLPAAA